MPHQRDRGIDRSHLLHPAAAGSVTRPSQSRWACPSGASSARRRSREPATHSWHREHATQRWRRVRAACCHRRSPSCRRPL
eukprot:9502583-Pyramimonas_sp.AAC.1